MTTWTKTATAIAPNGANVAMYQSSRTKLSIALCEVEGPLVHGFFTVSTEASDDDGCPHTLEHLVFLGSEDYPYKGVLDVVANRCFAQGTNAWTATDHTAYTVETAGSEGFLNILPIYLDHILFPTITDSGYTTEVHHVTGKGEDAGVVYCEMEGRENTEYSKINRTLVKRLYPGDCGENKETGGLLANLRALTVETVRQYHRDYYRPDNLCVIIAGVIKPEEVFKALEKIEDKIVGRAASKQTLAKNPWSTPATEMEGESEDVVVFPSDDESTGCVAIGFRTCDISDGDSRAALHALNAYLTEGAVSPFQQAFVECDDPFCHEVGVYDYYFRKLSQYVMFSGATADRIHEIRGQFKNTVRSILDKGIDIDRMRNVVRQCRLRYLQECESTPEEQLSNSVIFYFLYGNQNQAFLQESLDLHKQLEKLEKMDADFWKGVVQKFYAQDNMACVVARPSKLLAAEMQETEKLRVKAQAMALGEKRLAEHQAVLDTAMKENEKDIPAELVKAVALPDPSAVPHIPIASFYYNPNEKTWTQHTEAAEAKAVLDKLQTCAPPGLPLHLVHVHSNFVKVVASFDVTNVDPTMRICLELYLNTLFENPIRLQDGSLMSHDDVVRNVEAETVEHDGLWGMTSSSSFGGGSFSQLASVSVTCVREDFETAAKWVRDTIWRGEMTPNRIRVSAEKLQKAASELTRSGNFMSAWVLREHVLNNDAVARDMFVYRQLEYLKDVLKRLETEPETVVSEVSQFVQQLTAPGNTTVHVVANFLHVSDPTGPFSAPTVANATTATTTATSTATATAAARAAGPGAPRLNTCLRTAEDGSLTDKAVIFGLGACEGGYLLQAGRCLTDFRHPDVPALKVALQYLSALEGPFWKQIRGMGLAYGYSLYLSVEKGLLHFGLYRATNVPKAYECARRIVEDVISGATNVTVEEIEASRSSLVGETLALENTVVAAGKQAVLNFCMGERSWYSSWLLSAISQVTVDDVKRVLATYVKPLFAAESSRMAIALNPSKVDEVAKAFQEQFGRTNVLTVPNLENPSALLCNE
eukprot:Rmarinus@m.16579